MNNLYEDAVVVITGASTGLGRAIATGAGRAGARAIIINYASNAADAALTAQQVSDAGAEAVLVQGNVAEEEDCRRIIAAAEPYGRINAMFNNAGVSSDGSIDSFCADDFVCDYQVNVVGAFQMARAARALLEASGAGAIVNTSSIAGVSGRGTSPSYTASKGGLIALGKWLAHRFAPTIRVNNVCPGFIDTEWFEKQAPAGGVDRIRDSVRHSTLLKRIASAEDVAEVALFLGSPAACHMTGESLTVNGGPSTAV
jgi:3-oxoacyl-[acyl-carrier protein] reductase